MDEYFSLLGPQQRRSSSLDRRISRLTRKHVHLALVYLLQLLYRHRQSTGHMMVSAVTMCGMMAYWLVRLVCNVDSTGSSLVRDSYCVGTLRKYFAHNCSAILLHLRR